MEDARDERSRFFSKWATLISDAHQASTLYKMQHRLARYMDTMWFMKHEPACVVVLNIF